MVGYDTEAAGCGEGDGARRMSDHGALHRGGLASRWPAVHPGDTHRWRVSR